MIKSWNKKQKVSISELFKVRRVITNNIAVPKPKCLEHQRQFNAIHKEKSEK